MLIFLKISFQSLERKFLDSFLNEELDHFIQLSEHNPDLTIQRSKNWVIYKGDANNPNPELSFLSRYPEGIHDVEINQHSYDVSIKKNQGVRYILINNDTDFEVLESHLTIYLISAVLIILALATWYGLRFSKKVIEPVTSLASRIKMMNPERETRYLSDDYTNDEVGILALEFDAYSRRLQALVHREREFTGNASHELRTPLAVILAASEGLLAKKELSQDIIQRIERIQRSAKEMADRLETLLALARNRINAGESVHKTELASLLDQIIEDHGPLLTKGVRVIKNIQSNPSIHASGPIISMLMSNLIKNAFLYTRQGSVTIGLNEHEFFVIDTGCGIDKDEMKQIFERGFRGKSSRGKGLGLSIAKRICEYYGWQLNIESGKNKGTVARWLF